MTRMWRKVAIVAAAATAAFSVGMYMRSPVTGEDALGDVVAPVVRPHAALAAFSTRASVESSERLVPDVAFNPFGPLSLGAPATLGQPKAVALKPAKPASAAPPPPPPPPTAPPLPFVAVGSLSGADVAGGIPVAFLQQQDQLLVVSAGQTIGSAYRIEAITAQRIDLMYLPLMQRQSLQLAP